MISISDEEMKSLLRAVLTRYGIDFTNYEPKSFKRRTLKVIETHGFDSINSLWIRILKDPNFIYSFIDGITVGLTELFRNPGLWKALRDEILPSFSDQSSVNVWHAGCSTGEEVFSLGILLEEATLPFQVKAWATDINRQSLEDARKGKFYKAIFDKYQKNYTEFTQRHHGLEKYIKDEDESCFYLDNQLIKHVDLALHNLVTDDVENNFDIIFCRNVMIYFDKRLQERILGVFHKALKPNGYLVLGYYDSNPNAFSPRFDVMNPVTKTYRKLTLSTANEC